MAAMGNETQALESSSPNNTEHPYHHPQNHTQTKTPISLYEQSREERIKANLQRMQELGLKDLSSSLLNSTSRHSSRCGRPRVSSKPPVTPLSSPLPPSSTLRRSLRLQNTTPVTYSESVLAKKDDILEDVERKLNKSEVYTEEHEKLLGNTQRSWTLFVDGYGNDGRRIYDSFKGKTCHQCRQKTLGHRTHCVKCNMVQGQFCGDCLYMRYGEHVLEANENPNWVCPVCRGICNCSLCRQAKGWVPTGPLYKKITKLGFKSVAHYLIQTRRVQTNIGNDPDNTDQVSAKRSLSFPVPELPSEVDELVTPKPQTGEDGLTSEKKEYNAHPESNTLIFSKNETVFEEGEATEINLDVHGQHEKDTSHDETTGVNGEVLDGAGENVDENCTATESRQELMKRPASAMENGLKSNVASSKRSRELDNNNDKPWLPRANDSVSGETAENTSSRKESKTNMKYSTSGTNIDCVARRLRPRNKAL